jgi:hypothetical protein
MQYMKFILTTIRRKQYSDLEAMSVGKTQVAKNTEGMGTIHPYQG